VIAVICVNHLQRVDMGPEQLDRDRQVGGRLRDLHDLNERSVRQLDLLSGPGCGGV
jgi:hypothetical protein